MASEEDIEYIDAIHEYRKRKDEAFGSSPESPIREEQRGDHFPGLSYFPPEPSYQLVAEVVPFSNPEIVQLGSTKGDIRPQVRYAELLFTVGGQQLRLTGFKDPDGDNSDELFVPFRDATTGKETYGAGRYLEAEVERDERGALIAHLDFNLAYSPWCSYNDAYSCTLPPVENILPASITAGEKTYTGHA